MILKSSHSKYQLLNKIRYGLFVWEPRGGRFCAFLGLVLLENGVESVPGSRGLAQQPDFCFLAWGALLFINQGQKKKNKSCHNLLFLAQQVLFETYTESQEGNKSSVLTCPLLRALCSGSALLAAGQGAAPGSGVKGRAVEVAALLSFFFFSCNECLV